MKGIKLSIVFIVPGMEFSGGSLTRHSLGGSETAAVKLSEELVQRGHVVTVFSNCLNPKTGGPGLHNGVTYRPIQDAVNFIQNCQHDVLIVQRNSSILGVPNKAKMTILWNHDLAVKPLRAQIHKVLWNLNCITGLSKFHIDQQVDTLKIPKEAMWQTRNGITLSDFGKGGSKKNPKKLMYAARPERGLENLVGINGIMEQLLRIDPEIHLYVAGYDHTVPEMKAYYEALWGRIEQLPNCTNLGSLPKHVLYKHYEEAAVYAYPTGFEEISCISAIECMCAGVVVLTSRLGALPETLGDAGVFIDGNAATQEYKAKFIRELLILVGDDVKREQFIELGYKRSSSMDWSDVAAEWESNIFDYFAEQTNNEDRMLRHFSFYNDEYMCIKIKNQEAISFDKGKFKEQFEKCKPQIDSIAGIAQYRNNVKLEYAKKVISDLVKHGREVKTVLDYGCDIGQYIFGLAEVFPSIQFIGTDIVDEKIKGLQELACVEGVPENVSFYALSEWVYRSEKCDCVLSLDVLHLQKEPHVFIDLLEKSVINGGTIIISTPTGEWGDLVPDIVDTYSASALEGWMWNLERADLTDLLGAKSGYSISVGYAGKSRAGGIIGWHFVSYIMSSNRRTGQINIERKLAIQSPRQTVTLSMIVKDCESMLHQALKSVQHIVDDIVIVDTGSSDSTISIAKQYTNRVYIGPNPLDVGFAQARNETLKYIDTDWVVWIDSDEILLLSENLRKYLKDNVYTGYAIRQHHFSVQPVNCFKPDLPVRIWRTGKGVQFYGIIHEHVETEINKSVQPAMLLDDIEIAHNGYLTEEIRRGRFHRNINLLLRDRQENPERRLGRFLMMRDQIHMARYEIEASGGRPTPRQHTMCEEVIKAYREYFLGVADHMQIDGMTYYSEALRMLNRGFEITWNIVAAKQGPQMDQQGTRVIRIECAEDFKILINAQINGMCEPYEGKYA